MKYIDQIYAVLCNLYQLIRFMMIPTGPNKPPITPTKQGRSDSDADSKEADRLEESREKSTSPKGRSASLPEPSSHVVSDDSPGATGGSESPAAKSGTDKKIFNWFSKSPKKIFQSWTSYKRAPSRPICSSEVHLIDPSNWNQSISPIKRLDDQQESFNSPKSKSRDYPQESSNLRYRGYQQDSANSPTLQVERIDYANLSEEKIIPTFLSSRTCYDVMPTSGKVVVLSVELLVKNAFEALVNNELRAAPLWDISLFSFVGMLTISDFISVLRHYYCNAPDDIKVIESQTIANWRGINKVSKPVVKTNGMDNLALATKLLIEEGVHRVPVLDEERQSVLFILTRKRLLHYLYNNLVEKFGKTIMKTPSFLHKSIQELGVGTFCDIAKVTYDTKVIEALDLFVQRKVSALPIVDEDNILLDIFAKFDVFALAKEQTYHNLDMTINEAIDKGKVHEDVYGCKLSDTLAFVIQTIVKSKAHRLVVIDEKKSVIGMVSLSDILKFLVVQPLNKMGESSNPTSDTIEEAPEGAAGGVETDDSVFLENKQKSPEESDNDLKDSPVAEEEKSDDIKPKENIAEECEPEG